MGKAIDLSAITTGLSKVKNLAASLDTIAHDEAIEPEYIYPADNNPYAENDTPEELEALAQDIRVNGLIHPLVLNKRDDTRYILISGEKRFKAIRQYLNWKTIPCRVYSNLSPDRAQLMLHSANLRTREYTNEQKLRFYTDAETLLKRMKETGEYSGPIQKGLADLLGVSTRQIRRYKALTEKLDEQQMDDVASGRMSMTSALEMISEPQPQQDPVILQPAEDSQEKEPEPQFSEKLQDEESKFFSLPSEDNSVKSVESSNITDNGTFEENISDDEDDFILEQHKKYKLLSDEELLSPEWEPVIAATIRAIYNLSDLYLYYTFYAPTPKEAIYEKLRISSHCGGTFENPDGIYRTGLTGIEMQPDNGEMASMTYSQVDKFIRHRLRSDSFLSEKEILKLLRKHCESLKE